MKFKIFAVLVLLISGILVYYFFSSSHIYYKKQLKILVICPSGVTTYNATIQKTTPILILYGSNMTKIPILFYDKVEKNCCLMKNTTDYYCWNSTFFLCVNEILK